LSTSLHDSSDSTELEPQQIQELLETAISAARAAGSIILAHSGCSNQQIQDDHTRTSSTTTATTTVKFNIKDVVTKYDQQAQAVIEEIIRAKYPTHAFLGEESVGAGAQASEQALQDAVSNSILWIADPIDGTANFASGLPLCGVTVAVVYNGSALIGVIYDPHRDEVFAAVQNQGTTLNGKPIHVTKSIQKCKDAIINAGCPADSNAFAASMRGMLALNTACRGIRVVACSALTLSWIACGRLTAHFGYDLSSWDLASGALIIKEAGGVVTDIDGSPYKLETRNMLCSNGLVHQEVLDILTSADAVSFVRSK
jgi:myo-inositol-1(or 4)-monophosphatase